MPSRAGVEGTYVPQTPQQMLPGAPGPNTGFVQRARSAFNYLIRGADTSWFGPQQPLQPLAQEAAGRIFDYMFGQNLIYQPKRGKDEGVSFQQLRLAAEGCDMVRMCIETRKDQMAKLKWQIKPVDENLDPDDRCKKLTKFFQKPDQDHTWHQWQSLILDDHLTIDAATLYVRRTRGGDIYGFDPMDGSLITRLIDEDGATPEYPDPAYQQILKGMPAADYNTQELIYRPRYISTNRLYGRCYDDETEILTQKRGWVKFTDLNDGDKVATRSKDAAFEWQAPSRIVAEDYSGDMYHFTSRSMDLLVTPEHRMLVTSLPLALGGNKTRKGDAVISAKEFAGNINREVKIPVTSTWKGKEILQRTIYDPKHRTAEAVTLSGDDFCALLGAYIAEGNIRHQGGIEVAQRKSSKGYKIYKELFDRIGGSYNNKAFILSRRAVTKYFRQFGHAHEKFVPEIIRNATPRQIKIFWDFYMAGDGCYTQRHNKSGRGKNHQPTECAITVSKTLAGHLVELAQKIGISASVSMKPACNSTFQGRPIVCREAYHIRCRYSKAMSVTPSMVSYAGKIYCVTVPNGIVYVRRNGKPAWCGNSPVEQAIITINLAINRELSRLNFYTTGTLPEGFLEGPPSWTPKQLQDFQEAFNIAFSGNLEKRRQVPVVPNGMKWSGVKAEQLKDELDEWLARKICFVFSLPPTAFVKQMNRATGQQAQETAEDEGLAPLKDWFRITIMDEIIQNYFGYDDLCFSWLDEEATDPLIAAQIDDIYARAGVKAINEIRTGAGLDGVQGGEQPMIATANGYVPLGSYEDQMAQQQAQNELARQSAEAMANQPAADEENPNGADEKKGNAAVAAKLLKKKPKNIYASHPLH